jgi:hypothetical protein
LVDGPITHGGVSLALIAGANELLIGVANDFCGCGMVARLDGMEGISLAKVD